MHLNVTRASLTNARVNAVYVIPCCLRRASTSAPDISQIPETKSTSTFTSAAMEAPGSTRRPRHAAWRAPCAVPSTPNLRSCHHIRQAPPGPTTETRGAEISTLLLSGGCRHLHRNAVKNACRIMWPNALGNLMLHYLSKPGIHWRYFVWRP